MESNPWVRSCPMSLRPSQVHRAASPPGVEHNGDNGSQDPSPRIGRLWPAADEKEQWYKQLDHQLILCSLIMFSWWLHCFHNFFSSLAGRNLPIPDGGFSWWRIWFEGCRGWRGGCQPPPPPSPPPPLLILHRPRPCPSTAGPRHFCSWARAPTHTRQWKRF